MQMPQGSQENWFQLLPEEITSEILSRLPISNVLQARSVCQSWGNIVCSSPYFHKLWDEKNGEAWLFMDDCDGGVEIFNLSGEFKKKMFDSSSWLLKAASGGLLLYLNKSNKTNEMFQIVNPITMEARKLPKPFGKKHRPFRLKIKEATIDLIVDSATKSYQVIVLSFSGRTMNFLIYSSTTSSWEIKVVETNFILADWTLYKTVGNETIICFPMQGHSLASYNLCGQIFHANGNSFGRSAGCMLGKNVKVARWSPPVGRCFMLIFELDEASSEWRVVSVCRWNTAVEGTDFTISFEELLCEQDFVFSCVGASQDCLWIKPSFSVETVLKLRQPKDIFKGRTQDKSRAFPMPFRFSLRP